MATTGTPRGDRVLLAPFETPEMSPMGLIVIPDVAKEVPEMGVIEAVGPGKQAMRDGQLVTEPTGLMPGDVVMFSKYSGINIKLDGVSKIVLSADDVLMVVTEDEEAEDGGGNAEAA